MCGVVNARETIKSWGTVVCVYDGICVPCACVGVEVVVTMCMHERCTVDCIQVYWCCCYCSYIFSSELLT